MGCFVMEHYVMGRFACEYIHFSRTTNGILFQKDKRMEGTHRKPGFTSGCIEFNNELKKYEIT